MHIPGSRTDQPYQSREATAATGSQASQASGSRSSPYQPRGNEEPGSTGNRQPTHQPRGTAPTRGSTHSLRQVPDQHVVVPSSLLPVVSEEGEPEVK